MNRLPACRVCLAYNTRLCSMMDGQLHDIYETLVKVSLDTEDMLPTSACYICISLMKKILQFRDRSLKANQILQQMIICGLEPSVSSLDMLVKGQTGISWTLGISGTERTTTTLDEIEVEVKLESVKSEMDIDAMSDRNKDYSDSMPVCRDSTSDSEDDLPLQNIREQCKMDRVKIVETPIVKLQKSSGHAGAALTKKRKFDKIEAENELVNIQAPLRKTENDEDPRVKKRNKMKIPAFKKGNKKFNSPLETTETDTSIIISEKQIDNACNKDNTFTPTNDIYTCDLCKNKYQCKILLESHIKKSHAIELNQKDSIDSDLNVTNECKSTYLLKVQDMQNNDNRKQIHRRENKCSDNTNQFECEYCLKRFTSKSSLTRHLRVHTKEKPFKCDICEKCFNWSSHLINHLRVHTKEKPFKCVTCEKRFNRISHLIDHLRVHNKKKPYKCDICEKCFSESSNLTRHLRVHTKEKPFQCDICGKDFSQSSHLVTHLRVHTKEQPFKCYVCGKRFSQNCNLITHLRVHTKVTPTPFK